MIGRNLPRFHSVLAVLLLCLLPMACKQAKKAEQTTGEDLSRTKIRAFWRLYGEATQLRSEGYFRRAAQRYSEALDDNPAHEDSLYYLASCLIELGDYKEAVTLYEKLVKQNPASHRGHFQLGVTLSTPLPGVVLDFPRARQAFQRNIEINREESGPFLRLGELALYEGKVEEARKYFDIAAGFQSPEGIFRAGFVRYVMGEYSTALGLFQRVLDINANERKISGRGVQSEGDLQSAEGRFTPLERAGIQALMYLYWTAQRMGGYPRNIPTESRIAPPAIPPAPFHFFPLDTAGMGQGSNALASISSVRDLWKPDWKWAGEKGIARRLDVDLSSEGVAERVEAGNARILIFGRDGPPVKLAIGSLPAVDLAVSDFDGDGRTDIAGLFWQEGLRLYKNIGKNSFEDITARSGLPVGDVASFALASLDFDRDGRPDLLLAPYAPYVQVLINLAHPAAQPGPYSLRLFRNMGKGRFQEVPGLPGLSDAHGVLSAVSADFDGDGFPDLLLACGGLDNFRLEPSIVLHNQQGKAFTTASYLPGYGAPVRALGAQALDLDGDGRLDIGLRTSDGIRFYRNVPWKSAMISFPGVRLFNVEAPPSGLLTLDIRPSMHDRTVRELRN